MNKKIFRASFFTAFLVLAIAIAMVIGILFQLFEQQIQTELKSEANFLSQAVEKEGRGFLMIIALVLTWILSSKVSRAIIEPINTLDLESPENNNAYEELTPLLKKIAEQKRTIREQLEDARKMQKEFRLITENMKEGFLTIDRDACLLTCNSAALKLLNIAPPAEGNVLVFCRAKEFREIIEKALSGSEAESVMVRRERSYSLIANPVLEHGAVIGAVIIIFDVTEREKREVLRREFTDNVSHELKTPLTSISGFAELMKEGNVPGETVVDFSGSIYDEAQRLIALVSMKLKIGQKLAIVGENGSGKTTFIKLLCRLYDPAEGVILLNGIDITRYRYEEYMSLFSVVFQDFNLFAFSLAENVSGSGSYDGEKVKKCLIQAGFEERLKTLPDGIQSVIGRDYENDGIDLSGGEAQKIALARALYKDAPFMVLDEPTAALDPMAEAAVYESFQRLVRNKTAVFISHRLSSCRFCDDIIVFHKGSLVQRGKHDVLAEEEGKYRELWTAQAKYYN